jgi:GST-like protein
MESGAILIYLAEKSGKLLPIDPRQRSIVLQWLFFQVAGVGPMFGQFGHFFKYAGAKCNHPYPLERYTQETRRLLAVMDRQLSQYSHIAGDDYSIADIATFPWVHCLSAFYQGADQLRLPEFSRVSDWMQRCLARPAVQRGMQVCRPSN